MQKRVECTYGFLTCLKYVGIYVELLGRCELHFTGEDCVVVEGLNKQIFEELAELICSGKTIAPLYKETAWSSAGCSVYFSFASSKSESQQTLIGKLNLQSLDCHE
jgi:hypothetical protein